MEKFKERPIQFIAGDADETIPMENSKKLWEEVKNSKDEFWVVPGAKHVGAYSALESLCQKRISDDSQSANQGV